MGLRGSEIFTADHKERVCPHNVFDTVITDLYYSTCVVYVVVDMMRIKNRMFWSRETSRQNCRESSRIFKNLKEMSRAFELP